MFVYMKVCKYIAARTDKVHTRFTFCNSVNVIFQAIFYLY